MKQAIASLEAVSVITPNDANLFFQLGLLRFSDGNFSGAGSAFERALTLTPSSINAKYYLALTLDKIGKHAESIALFEEIQKLNPDIYQESIES